MTTKELINQYVTAHADNRWMDASELEALLTEFAEKLKEPASEDLEKEMDTYFETMQVLEHENIFEDTFQRIAKHFAQWQKEQFEKNGLAHCDAQTEEEAEVESDFVMGIIGNEHRHPTFDDAIKYGMRLQKEQMMKDAIQSPLQYDEWGRLVPIRLDLAGKGFQIGDKVKVIIIKE